MLGIRQIFFTLLILLIIVASMFGCEDIKDNLTLFEKFGNGLDILSREGETDIWNMSVTKDGDTVTILESFYNRSSIYIGFALNGEELIANEPVPEFRYDGKMIGNLGHGGFLVDPEVPPTLMVYAVMQPGSYNNTIDELPDEFILDFTIREASGLKRTFEFKIPLERSDKEVTESSPGSKS